MTSQRKNTKRKNKCQLMAESSCRLYQALLHSKTVKTTYLYLLMIGTLLCQTTTTRQNNEHYTSKGNSKWIRLYSIKASWVTSSGKDILKKYHRKIYKRRMGRYGMYPIRVSTINVQELSVWFLIVHHPIKVNHSKTFTPSGTWLGQVSYWCSAQVPSRANCHYGSYWGHVSSSVG